MEDRTFDCPWKIGKKYRGFRVTNGGFEFKALCVGIEEKNGNPAPIFKIGKNEPCVANFVANGMDSSTLVNYTKMNILGIVTIEEVE